MRLLVIGTGLMGRYLCRAAAQRGWDVVATWRGEEPDAAFFAPLQGASPPVLVHCDITRPQAVEGLFERARPEAAVLAAGISDMERCEADRVAAQSVNVWAARTVARVAASRNVPLLHLSTAYVFDGRKGHYREGDPTNPVNFYGLTMLEGERAVTGTPNLAHVVLRCSLAFGLNPRKRNLATQMLAELAARRPVQAAQDQWDTFCYAGSAAETAVALLEKSERGLYHAAGAERINQHGLAKHLADEFRHDPNLVRPAKLLDLRHMARRPPDCSLNAQKAEKATGLAPLPLREGLRRMHAEAQARAG